MTEERWTADDAQCEVIRENMRAHERSNMKKYIVRYEQIYSTIVEARSEEEAINKVSREDFTLDETSDYEAEETEPISVIIGICKEDNPRDVDEAYGAGTYARLFPENNNDSK